MSAPLFTHVRGTHRYHFRSGVWAEVLTTVQWNERDCWMVRFPDGVVDYWVITDPSARYEFSPDPDVPGRPPAPPLPHREDAK